MRRMHRSQWIRTRALVIVPLVAASLTLTLAPATGDPAGSEAVTPVTAPPSDAGVRTVAFTEGATSTELAPPPPPPSRSVAILGDSIFWMTAETMKLRHGADWALQIDAVIGAKTIDQLGAVAGLAERTDPRGQLVVELGTNDSARGLPLDESRRAVQQILAGFPEVRCIHLVTVTDVWRETAPDEVWAEAVAYNDMLREFTSDPRVRMVEWAGLLSANDATSRGSLLVDDVHPNGWGSVALADLVAGSLAACDR